MRKILFIYMICVGTLGVSAQNEVINDTDTTQTVIVSEPQVVVTEKTTEEKLQEALQTIEDQKKHLLELRDIEVKLNVANRDKESLDRKAKEAEKHAESVEKSLISMASNFLYVPYEAYGVEEIAIKAFESIQNTKLKQEYNQRYILLKNYQNHLREFKAYLERVQKACKAPFQATATEFIDSTDPKVSPELILKKQPFYLEYSKYNEYRDTFIGGLIQKTESILKAHTKQNKANVQGVIEEIDKTQSQTEIDSIEKVVNVIDERLKTVEDL